MKVEGLTAGRDPHQSPRLDAHRKPALCRFCGTAPIVRRTNDSARTKHVLCETYGCHVTGPRRLSAGAAVNAWNTMHVPAPGAAALAELRAQVTRAFAAAGLAAEPEAA